MKEIKYIEIDGLLYPDLKLPAQKELQLSRFGVEKLRYLKRYQSGLYFKLLATNELVPYLEEFDSNANNLYDKLVIEFKSKWNVNEKLKEENQMKWVQLMNNIDNIVKVIILNEYVYKQ